MEVAKYLKIIIPSVFVVIPGLLLEQFINGRGDFSLKIIIYLSSFIAMFLCLILFYSNLSPFFIAISISFSNIILSLTIFFVIKFKYNIQISSFIPNRNDCILIMKFIKFIK